MEKPQGGIQTLDRAFQLLEIIAETNQPIALKEIAALADLPKPTVYRLLSGLEAWGYLEQDDAKGYQLGTKFLTFGAKVQARLQITQVAQPYLKALNEATKETVFLGIRDKGRSLYVSKFDSHHSVRLASNVGSRNYLHCTALGKCFLAALSNDEVNSIIRDNGLPRLTGNTITDPEELVAAIDQVRLTGYAVDDCENEEGVRCVAAPVRDYEGKVVAAVSISGPVQRISREYIERNLLPELRKTVQGISQALGYSG